MSAEMSSERMVDIGGYRLCLSCAGQGAPTVVIDAGVREGLNEWRDVDENSNHNTIRLHQDLIAAIRPVVEAVRLDKDTQ